MCRRDHDLRVFGAKTHRYRSTTVVAAHVAGLERALGVSLPPEYRDFLVNVEFGAGPYYGVWSPEQSLADYRDLAQEYEAEGGVVDAASPFPISVIDLRGLEADTAAANGRAAVERDWPCSGCLPICHQGCDYWSVLVLTGDFVGRVWDVACFVGYSGERLPARRPPGRVDMEFLPKRLPRLPAPPTFSEWFDAWVERCLCEVPLKPAWRLW